MRKSIILVCLTVACGKPEADKKLTKVRSGAALIYVKQLFQSAAMYYDHEFVDAQGQLLPKQFPASIGPTPPRGACCKDGHPQACAPDPTLWTGSWQMLKFAVAEPSYYSYQFKSSGTGPDATFTVSAYGDSDCNGVYSTFELTGKVKADGTIDGAQNMITDHETE